MLKAINTKILLAILAALTAIGGVLTYQRPSFSNSRRRPTNVRPRMKRSESV